MNKNVKNVIKFATFVALFVGIITPIAHFLFVPLNSDITSYGSFYKEKENSLDLVMAFSKTSPFKHPEPIKMFSLFLYLC